MASEATPSPVAGDLRAAELYLNRELSELAFHNRVLNEALDKDNPLLERVRFLAIFSSNMDEFFMKRVGGLKRQLAAGVSRLTPDGRTPAQQWRECLMTAHAMLIQQMRCYKKKLRPALKRQGIRVLHYKHLSKDQKTELRGFFERAVLPILTPLAVDPAHPFPFISNLSLSLGVLTRRRGQAEPTFVRIKIPANRPRLVQLGDTTAFVPLEQIVGRNLDLIFPRAEILSCHPFRVTRNADVTRNEEEASDLLEMIQEELRQRRFATVVRLEVDKRMPDDVRRLLIDGLRVTDAEVFEVDGFLDFRGVLSLTELHRPDLMLPPWEPRPHPSLRPDPMGEESPSIFHEIRRQDLLVHHPYHSFTETVHRFVEEAAHDPRVLAIKMVIYRTARESQILRSLLKAVENGKQVAVMIELRARFDEELNIEWVNILEQAGVHVAYGMLGYKTHSKITLVVREEADGLRRYAHVATGNYHSETANAYVDLGLLTADPSIGRDVGALFNFLTGHAAPRAYESLLVAPTEMRRRFTELIRAEAVAAAEGRPAAITAKMNSLEDPDIVEELYRASRAGVEIDLIVRGICRLRPGLEGISDNIRVTSVVGRFLEHSRIYRFENGGEPLFFIGSADWMRRNLDYRVEAVVPITDPELKSELQTILDTMLSDNRKAWDMLSDGTYRQRSPAPGEPPRIAQRSLMNRVVASLEQ